jgi:hypothetical protein
MKLTFRLTEQTGETIQSARIFEQEAKEEAEQTVDELPGERESLRNLALTPADSIVFGAGSVS